MTVGKSHPATPHGSLFSGRFVSLALSLVAILVIYFVRSPWTSVAVPVVWLSAYCFGWYECDQKEADRG